MTDLSERLLKRSELRELYDRLSGEPKNPETSKNRLLAILRDFYGRMAQDVLVGFFFTGKNTDDIAAKQAEFLMRAMGVTPSYSGKAPAQAHDVLPPILPGHFDRRLRILEQTLKDHGLSDEDIHLWVEFENAFREGIVTRNPGA